MSWHIVGAFKGMNIIRRVFWYHFVEMAFKILSHRGIGVFVDGEGGRGMVNKNMGEAHANFFEFRDLGFDLRSDEMKSSGKGSELKRTLIPSQLHRFLRDKLCVPTFA